MKQQRNEIKRMQQLAGILNEAKIVPDNTSHGAFKKLFANFDILAAPTIENRFARTMSELLTILSEWYGYMKEYECNIDMLFTGEMEYVEDGNNFYAGPTETLKFFEKLPKKFIVTNNINGDHNLESFEINKTELDTFNAKPI